MLNNFAVGVAGSSGTVWGFLGGCSSLIFGVVMGQYEFLLGRL